MATSPQKTEFCGGLIARFAPGVDPCPHRRQAFYNKRICLCAAETLVMLVLGWRFIVLAAYALWQGGFFFYTAEVVPIGTDVLGSATSQGFITRRVAIKMNQFGAAALAIFALDLYLSRDRSKLRRRL